MPVDVLLFGSMGDIGLVALEALVSSGVSAVHVDFPQNVFRDEPGYRRDLLKAVSRFSPRYVIPVGHPLCLARMRDSMPDGVEALVESEDKIRLLDSKCTFWKYARDLGLRVPRRYESPADIHEGARVVFKRDVSFGGHGVHVPKSLRALENLIAHQSPGEPYLIQEFLEGDDYSVDAVRLVSADGTATVKASPYRFAPTASFAEITGAEIPAPGTQKVPTYCGGQHVASVGGVTPDTCAGQKVAGDTTGPAGVREIVDYPELCRIAAAVLDSLDYVGLCGFDFRVTSDGVPYLLEANPRLTGGLSTQLHAGFNIPLLLLASRVSYPFCF